MRLVAGALICGALLGARDASSYTIETAITDGCHESIAAAALRNVRAEGRGLPLPSTDPDDAAVIGDVPFTLPGDLADIGGVALLLGMRNSDIGSLAAGSLDELAQVTADPAQQREHCLRTSDEKEPTGTTRALGDCRQFIKDKLMGALDGLGPDGTPDVRLRDPLDVTMALRGRITVSLPRFYLRVAAALHALQDGFTHTFRRPDDPHVVTVDLNWIDYADGTLNEATDGPPHLKELDRCDDPDDLRATRHRLAIEASTAALSIALDPTLSRDQKSVDFDHLLDTYLVDGSGQCTAANGWCNAPENQYRPPACGCGDAVGRGGGWEALWMVALAAGAIVARRRRGAVVAAVSLVIGSAGTASADEDHGPMTALNHESHAGTPGTTDPKGAFFGHAAFGASYDHAALSLAAGARYQVSRPWMIGLDVEWNPWVTTSPWAVRAGAGNVYASIIRRFQMAAERVNIRSTAALGASMLLIDLPGAPKWGLGPLLGISFLGIEWKMAPGYFLVVDPTYLIFAVPHVTGIPLGYYQYRFQVGIDFGG